MPTIDAIFPSSSFSGRLFIKKPSSTTSIFPLNLYLTPNNSTLTDPLSMESLPDNFGLSGVPFTVKTPLSLPFKSLATVGSRNELAN